MNSDFRTRWLAAVEAKQSLLCVGIDAAEHGQRGGLSLSDGQSKLDWTLGIVEKVAPYAAAIKLNRNYYKDFSRTEMQKVTARVRELGMLSMDDTKLADIGDTNAAAMHHAKAEGYDSLTYAPFPGNQEQASEQAKAQGLGLIMLVLMSNPEFAFIKQLRLGSLNFSQYLASEATRLDIEGVVIGASSPSNHITPEELDILAEVLQKQLVLVPGVGAQGGSVREHLARFGRRTMVNVGRAIIYAADPAAAARAYREQVMEELAQF